MISLGNILLMLLGSFLGAWGLFLFKRASFENFLFLLRQKYFWAGIFLNGFSVLAYFVVLRQEQVSVVYPFASLTYLWTTWFSVKYLGEKMNSWKWLGLAGIMLGVSLIGLGS